MKQCIMILAGLMFSFAVWADCGSCDNGDKKSCADKSGSHHTASMTDAGGAINVKVTGMSCAGCVKKLKDEVAKITKGDGVTISVEKDLVKVDYSKAKLDEKSLAKLKKDVEAAVKAADFDLG